MPKKPGKEGEVIPTEVILEDLGIPPLASAEARNLADAHLLNLTASSPVVLGSGRYGDRPTTDPRHPDWKK